MQNDIAEFKPDVIILLTILALICVLQNGQKRNPNTLLHIAQYGLGKKIASLTSKKMSIKCMLFYPLKNIL
jgi:hypothetical protein